MADINCLPHEVLVRIFHYYLRTELQWNFLNCVSNVCKNWKEVSRDSSFFETLDGTIPLSLIASLAKEGALQRTKTLKFSKVTQENKNHYKTIYSCLPRLEHLDLTGVCHKLHKLKEHPVLSELEGLCPDLCELVVSHPDARCKAIISNDVFLHILSVRNFVKLDFSSVWLLQLQKLFVHISANCPNLEELLAQYIKGTSPQHRFPTELMQKGCPKLKILRLGYPIFFNRRPRKDNAVGFPDMEIFTHPSREDYHFTSSDFEALLYKSPKLKILDFRGCLFVTFEAVHALPTEDLEQIHVSFTRIAENRGVGILFQKWSHSLNVIDISNVKGEHINEIFKSEYLPDGLPNLEVLEVSNSAIEEETVETLIRQCPKLRHLNLEGCRRMKRGTKSVYRSRSEIVKLPLKFDKNKMDSD